MTTELRQLYSFTRCWLDEARVQARHGQKDSARQVLKFVRGACILDILKQHDFPVCMRVDVSHLEWQLRELENDCHPSAVSDHKDDFTAIRSSLETLAQGMQMILKGQKSNEGPTPP
jgi:hypothetical protein